MQIGRIDESATLGDSWLHRISPVSKLVALGLLLAAVVLSWNVLVVASLMLSVLSVAISARLKRRLVLTLAGYPTVFALIFAFSAATSVLGGLVIVLKAVTAALGAVVVILTTPYPYVFAPVQRVVPTIVGDALLMTYRSLFLLLEKFGNLLVAARLRAGLSAGHPVRTAKATTRALGGLLLYSFDLSQRSYDIMRMRGYEGRLHVSLPKSRSPRTDGVLLAGATVMLGVSLAWRLEYQSLNPYSWVVAGVALLGLAAACVAGREPKGRPA